jgi:hypothetical protein
MKDSDAAGQAPHRHFLIVSLGYDLDAAVSNVAPKRSEGIVLCCYWAVCDCQEHVALP